MSYSAKVKKINKTEDGGYFIQNYSIGFYIFGKIIGAIICFPFKILFGMFFRRKK